MEELKTLRSARVWGSIKWASSMIKRVVFSFWKRGLFPPRRDLPDDQPDGALLIPILGALSGLGVFCFVIADGHPCGYHPQ